MAHQAYHASVLQVHNKELAKCLEDLRGKRNDLTQQIAFDDDQKKQIQNEIRLLSKKLTVVNEGLAKKLAARVEYDKTIAETEHVYLKILDSSEIVVGALKKEASGTKK